MQDSEVQSFNLGFVETMESPGIKTLRFSGLENHGKVLEF